MRARVITCTLLLALAACSPARAGDDAAPPFRLQVELPTTGEYAAVVDSPAGVRVANLAAQIVAGERGIELSWDLKDVDGHYVAPGEYRVHGIVGPPPTLHYIDTPYPNIRDYFPDRVPWMKGHAGAAGWLSDHSQNWAVTTCGDRVYFGAPMAEAGVCLIECDRDGRKLWGKHDFGAWQGVNRLAADARHVYIEATSGTLHRLDPQSHQITALGPLLRPGRRGTLRAIAAHDGRVYLAYGGRSGIDNAANGGDVDLAASLPASKNGRDFLRALRLVGTPPGRERPSDDATQPSKSLTYLESTYGTESRQHLVVAFRQPVSLGSLILPWPETTLKVEVAVLRPDAPYPPRVDADADWLVLPAPTRPGWSCLTAPAGCQTRALRFRWQQPGSDELDVALEAAMGAAADDDVATLLERPAADARVQRRAWLARLEGLRLLRRRYQSIAPDRVLVNSGEVRAGGAWDARRTIAVWHDSPGIYVMEWTTPQTLNALAIKEIDGAVTEIDVWQGDGPIDRDGESHDAQSDAAGWRHVATYKQPRRWAYVPSDDNNVHARYLDGLVDFHGAVNTRAVRLRITEQWLDHGRKEAEARRHDGPSEHGVHYRDSITARLDTRLCAIDGILALRDADGDTDPEPLLYDRLEVRDGQTGELIREWPMALGWNGLSCAPDGSLYSILADHRTIARIDTDTGKQTVVLRDATPSKLAVGPDGRFYVNPWGDDTTPPIRVYSPDGKLERTIGHPGAIVPGPWDPQRLGPVAGLAVSADGSLWLAEALDNPRRILQFDVASGELHKEILGNTHYGGGGTLHRFDASRGYHGAVELNLPPVDGASRIRRLLPMGGDYDQIRLHDRIYWVSVPPVYRDRQAVGTVYIEDSPDSLPRPVAAFGDAGEWPALRTAAIITAMGGAPPQDFLFAWSDRDDDGRVGLDEITFTRKTPDAPGAGMLGRFDHRLGCPTTDAYYTPASITPSGVPIYERRDLPTGGHLVFADGSILSLHAAGGRGLENRVWGPDGALRWRYPVASAGVSGLSIGPWQQGRVDNEFGVIGHEIEAAGELGEFVVVHANTGQWRVWTRDGLLAAQVMLHRSDPRAAFFGPDTISAGQALGPLTAGQEHFHGWFGRVAGTEGYRLVAGFTHMSILQVTGLAEYRRFATTVTVTVADLQAAAAWERLHLRQDNDQKDLQIVAPRAPVDMEIDGDAPPHEWAGDWQSIDAGVAFNVQVDDANLYVCWRGEALGEFTNSGDDFRQFFKTGSVVDLYLGTDPQAPADRRQPQAGDLRLLIARLDGTPRAVLYRPVATGEPAAVAWDTRTEAGGEVHFDSVALAPTVQIAIGTIEEVTTIEARIPLSLIDWKPRPDAAYRIDWGVTLAADGRHANVRACWANRLATGTADVAVEARLEPALWGKLRFAVPVSELDAPE